MAENKTLIIVKKYANRRLYDTSQSAYITLKDLAKMVKSKIDFKVEDAKSGEDITRSILAQIIFEQENEQSGYLLPTEFLRQLISYYGDSMQSYVPSYLQFSIQSLTEAQENMRAHMQANFSDPTAMMQTIQDQTRRNFAMFQKSFEMMNPFANQAAETDQQQPQHAPTKAPQNNREAELNALKAQVAQMQKELKDLKG